MWVQASRPQAGAEQMVGTVAVDMLPQHVPSALSVHNSLVRLLTLVVSLHVRRAVWPASGPSPET